MTLIKCLYIILISSLVTKQESPYLIKWNILADETREIYAFAGSNGSTVQVYPPLRLALPQGNFNVKNIKIACTIYPSEIFKQRTFYLFTVFIFSDETICRFRVEPPSLSLKLYYLNNTTDTYEVIINANETEELDGSKFYIQAETCQSPESFSSKRPLLIYVSF